MDASQVPMAGYLKDDGKWFKGIEDYIPKSQYKREKHQTAVVQDIRDHWMPLSRGGRFHAIFATSSIPEAIQYYDLFCELCPKLKVAALFAAAGVKNFEALPEEKPRKLALPSYSSSSTIIRRQLKCKDSLGGSWSANSRQRRASIASRCTSMRPPTCAGHAL